MSDGFVFETPLLDLEIYRLITMLEASPALAEFEAIVESDRRQWEALRELLEFTEISRIVVSLAAIIRSALDANPIGGGTYTVALERPVGVLFSENREPEILQFREACNKVLHADRVDLETTGGSGDTRGALTGNLIMRGRQLGTEWRAELDLKQYALSALTLVP